MVNYFVYSFFGRRFDLHRQSGIEKYSLDRLGSSPILHIQWLSIAINKSVWSVSNHKRPMPNRLKLAGHKYFWLGGILNQGHNNLLMVIFDGSLIQQVSQRASKKSTTPEKAYAKDGLNQLSCRQWRFRNILNSPRPEFQSIGKTPLKKSFRPLNRRILLL